ncbi:Spo0B domain-containing protein [Pelosinus propionicus]|nr:sensor histidine kinase [Pelosinus propionicus]
MQKKRISLQYKIMLLTVGIVCLALTLAGAFVIHHIYQEIQDDIGNRALSIGRSISQMPQVRESILYNQHPSDVLQPIAEEWRKSTGAAFIVISNMNQIRLSHPTSQNLGTPLTSLYRDPVLKGQEYMYIAKGSLAPSLRANVPIFAVEGQQIGFVSVGFYIDEIYNKVLEGGKNVLYALLIALILSIIGSALVAKNIKKAIYGLEPYEIATMFRENEATLDALREGVVAVDVKGIVRVINNEAAAIIGKKPEEIFGQAIANFIAELRLDFVIDSGKALYDQEQRVNDVIILANVVPTIVDDHVVGAVIAFRDRTEISRLAEEMTGVHRFVDLLRAQTHEFKNKLHAVAGLIQLGSYEQAVDLIIESYDTNQDEFEKLRYRIKDTVTFGLLVGKMSRARELGIEFIITSDTAMQNLPGQLTSGDMVIILGNLIENATEAVAAVESKKIILGIREEEAGVAIMVQNSGPWINESLGDSIYVRGMSGKGAHRGYGLALVSEKIKVNNGFISHCNLPEGGVEFKVWIPYCSKGENDEEN